MQGRTDAWNVVEPLSHLVGSAPGRDQSVETLSRVLRFGTAFISVRGLTGHILSFTPILISHQFTG